MNAKLNTTIVPFKANPVDPARIGAGSMVYVDASRRADGTTVFDDASDADGFQIVVSVDGDELTGDTGDSFQRQHVVAHLEDALVVEDPAFKGYPRFTTNNELNDSLLIGWGRELMELAPEAARRWLLVEEARSKLDVALDRIKRRTGKRPDVAEWHACGSEGAAWDSASRYHNEVGNRAYLLLHAVNWSSAYTFQGMAAKAAGLYYELHDQAGTGPAPKEPEHTVTLSRDLMNDLAHIVDRLQPRRPVGELADLITAHREALALFEATCDDADAARSALGSLRGNSPILSPARIRDGRIVASVEVVGDDDHDLHRIREAHDHWKRDLSFKSVEQVSSVAALAISQIIDASLTECLRLYEVETKPMLAVRNAEYQPALDAYDAANEAEREAVYAVARYRPQSLEEVAEQARYLADIEDMDGSVRQAFCDAIGAMDTEHITKVAA